MAKHKRAARKSTALEASKAATPVSAKLHRANAKLAALQPLHLTPTARWQLLFSLSVIIVLLYLLAPILTPFAVAALFAYLGDPSVDKLQERGLSRTWAVSVVFLAIVLVITAIVLVLVPLIESQVSRLIEKLPSYVETARYRLLPWVQTKFGVSAELLDLDKLIALLREHWRSAGGVAATVLKTVGQSGLTLVGWIINLTLVPVLLFYFLRDWDGMVERVRELLPRHLEPTISGLAAQSDEVLGAFLRGQMSVMAALAGIYTAGFMFIGLDLALLIGIGAGLVSFIPYLGGMVGVGGGLIAAYMQFGDWQHPAMVLVVYAIGQSLEGMVLTPWLVGDKIGMHPVAVIFAILAGGQLFGFLGVLLALPVAAIVMVILRYLHVQYKGSELYVGSSKPTESHDV
jgi:predicted PurR-regulated permease PerM